MISDIDPVLAANLHHTRCHPSNWDDQVFTMTKGNLLSYRTYTCAIPGEVGGRPQPMPFMFVNPSLEQVMLHSTGSGWEISTVSHFRDCGLTGLNLTKPAPGTHASLRPGGVVHVQLEVSMEGWQFGTTPEILALIRQLRGVALGATTAYLPDQQFTTLAGFAEAMQSGDLALGWVQLL
ncbi:hypothetical protein ACWIGW_44340 [Nocardia brasiliensis]|uniref:hypothetical protein n=1 Tax=Streptomyces sp. NPDC056056 TaxID=3345698 RepID=UPI0035DFEF6C